MSNDLELLVDTSRRILAGAAWSPGEVHSIEWPSDTWNHLETAGLTGLSIAENYGGSGGSFVDAATVVFEVGRVAAPVPFLETVLAGWLAAEAGWSRTGDTETVAEGSGSVTLEVRGQELVLTGTLRDVPWARESNRILVLVEEEDRSLVGSIDPAEATIERRCNLAGEPRDDVVIRELVLPPDRWARVRTPVARVRERAALLRCTAAAGAMTTVADMTVDYAGSRTQFGRSIGQFQAVQQMLAQQQGQAAAAVTAARAAAGLVSKGDGGPSFASAAAIVRVLRAIPDVARIAHQVHGAIGITREHTLHRWTTRLWSTRTDTGGEAQWSATLLQRLAELGGAARLWPALIEVTEGGGLQ